MRFGNQVRILPMSENSSAPDKAWVGQAEFELAQRVAIREQNLRATMDHGGNLTKAKKNP